MLERAGCASLRTLFALRVTAWHPRATTVMLAAVNGRRTFHRSMPRSLPPPSTFRGGESGSDADGESGRDISLRDQLKAVDSSSLRRLAKLIRPEWAYLGTGVGLTCATTAVSLAFPAAMGAVVDVAAGASQTYTPGDAGLMLAGLFGVQAVVMVGRMAILTLAGERIAARLRTQVFDSILSQPTSFFDQSRSGELVNRLSADCSALQKAITGSLPQGVRSLLTAIGSVGMMAYVSPKLMLVALSAFPPMAGVGVYLGRKMKHQQAKVQTALAEATATAADAIRNIRLVREFGGEPQEAARYRERVDHARARGVRIGMTNNLLEGLIFLGGNMSMVAVLAFGGNQVLAGDITIGQLSSFLMYSLFLGFNTSSLSTVGADIIRSLGASTRIFELLDAPPSNLSSMTPHTGTSSQWLSHRRPQGNFSFENVRFTYPGRDLPALEEVTLNVPAGSVLAVVGASGSGKSTIARMLTRLYDPEAGHIRIDGTDIRDIDVKSLRRWVGIVPQDAGLLDLSVRENIRYGFPEASQEEVEKAARIAQAHDFIVQLPKGYDTPVGEAGTALSGGQRQRIALARALVHDPAVMVMDEATSALDAVNESALHEAIQHATRGRTTIIIAHRIATVRHADTVCVVDAGRVVEMGSFDSLMARPNGRFRKLAQLQLNA